jgi:DNA-binding NtrC family response regulator
MSKILICDPEEGIRESLKLTLGDLHDLILTADVAQGLECLSYAKDIGLLFLNVDGASPDFSPEAVTKIKENHPQLPIIAIAGHKGAAKAKEAVQLGAAGCFARPFKTDEVVSAVARILK